MSALTTGAVKKRTRRTNAQIQQLDDQIVSALKNDHPQSVRHIYYCMTNPRLPEFVEKTEHGYKQVQARITKLRRGGRIRYDWITDATRRGYHTHTYNGTADFLKSINSLYRADVWKDAGVYLEIWCESRSIAGVIEDDCDELAVSLYPAGGFSSITLAYQAAEYINHRTNKGKIPAVILYIGDYDPAGVLIDLSIEKEIREHLSDGVHLEFKRIALTDEQIRLYDLPTKPRKPGDKRALHVAATVEAEAMPAHVLRDLLRTEIESYMPEDALSVAKAAEKSEREYLYSLASVLEKTRG